jgi:hypothetical protein
VRLYRDPKATDLRVYEAGSVRLLSPGVAIDESCWKGELLQGGESPAKNLLVNELRATGVAAPIRTDRAWSG